MRGIPGWTLDVKFTKLATADEPFTTPGERIGGEDGPAGDELGYHPRRTLENVGNVGTPSLPGSCALEASRGILAALLQDYVRKSPEQCVTLALGEPD